MYRTIETREETGEQLQALTAVSFFNETSGQYEGKEQPVDIWIWLLSLET